MSSQHNTDKQFTTLDGYDAELHAGLSVSGENKEYFARGRLGALKEALDRLGHNPASIMDFGCGLGETTAMLAEGYPVATVTGIEPSENFAENARKVYTDARIQFKTEIEESDKDHYDLCYVNGVFHHIEPEHRSAELGKVHESLKRGGIFAFFENNILNPGTRYVMKRIEFDRDAKPFTHMHARKMLMASGFDIVDTKFLFVFPKLLGWLRPLERQLTNLPLGAQYFIIARKP